MYPILLHLHSGIRYLVLLLLVFVIVKAFYGILKKNKFSKLDKITASVLSISAHIQFLTGIILYFYSPYVMFSKYTMTNESYRYWTLEHILMMVIAITLITLGGIFSKKATGNLTKFKRLLIYNSIALVIIVVTILLSGRGLV